MTSRISFSRSLKQNIFQRAWLFTLSLVLLLFCQTFSIAATLDQQVNHHYDLITIQELLPSHIANGWLVLLIPLLAVLTAASGFSYLHSTEKTDLMHSLPLSRTQWFFIAYSGGLLSFVLPYALSSLCSLAVGIPYGALTSRNLLPSLLMILRALLGFLLLYHTAILAMMLTGKLLTGMMGTAALCIYSGLLVLLYAMLADIFWSTYYPVSSIADIFRDLSPAVLFVQLISYGGNPSGYPAVLPAVLLASALLAAAWYLYKKRASEAAGQPLAFPKSAPFIKILAVVPLSLGVGAVFAGISYNRSELKWLVIFSLTAAFILCGVVEFIYHGDLKQILSGKLSSLTAILCTLCILFTLLFDLPGYDTWIPDESRLEDMSFYTYPLNSYFLYPDDSDLNDPDNLLKKKEETAGAFHPLYELAEKGVENVRAGITQRNIPSNATDATDPYLPVTIAYHKKNGASSFRNYEILQSDVLDAFAQLCEDEGYRKMIFPIFSVDPEDVIGISALDIYYERPTTLPFTRSQQDELLEAYKADILSTDIYSLQYEQPVGALQLQLSYPSSQQIATESYLLGNFFVYKDHRHTLALLEKYGYTFRSQIDPEDISQLTLYTSSDSDTELSPQGAAIPENGIVIRDPTELAKLVPQLCAFTQGLLGNNGTFSRSAEVLFNDSASPSYYSLP